MAFKSRDPAPGAYQFDEEQANDDGAREYLDGLAGQAKGNDDGKPAPVPVVTFRVEGDQVVWKCECGRERQAASKLAGRIAPCPTCKARTIVPGNVGKR